MCWNRFATLAWVLFISLHFLCLIPGAVSCVINLEEVSLDDLLSARPYDFERPSEPALL